MATTSTTGVSSLGATAQSTSTASPAVLPEQTLNQNDFLQLLVAQLSAQDPMNPVSNTDFIAQMAQFSTLQNSTAMQQNMASLQANSLLGQTVQVQSATGQAASGVVSAVSFKAGVPSLTVNGQTYSLSEVLSVSQTQTPTTH